MAKLYVSPAGIASYANLIEPRADQKGKMKYSVSVLISKARSKELDPLRAIALEVATAKFGAKAKAFLENARNPFIKDGDKKVDDEGKVDPQYKGHWFISARSDRKPEILDAAKQPVFDDSDETGIYSGCLIRIMGGVFAYEAEGNRGVSIGLNGVQLLKRLPRIDGRKAASEVFSEWTDTEAPVVDPLA